MTRRDLKPGTVFVLQWLGESAWCWPRRDAWVVIDSINEVGFWSGARTVMGDVMPGVPVEIVC